MELKNPGRLPAEHVFRAETAVVVVPHTGVRCCCAMQNHMVNMV
jgi:hypothetical protein